MKETLDLVRTIRPNKSRSLAFTVPGPQRSSVEPLNDPPITAHSVSDGAVWIFLAILLLLIAVTGYIFWAKLNSAWPFNFQLIAP